MMCICGDSQCSSCGSVQGTLEQQQSVSLYLGDCAAIMAERIGDASIDLTVTSPPYDNLRTYKGFRWNFEDVAKQLWRVTKPGGVVVWVVNDETKDGSESGTSFYHALYFKSLGFNLHDTMIWEKDSFAFPDTNRYRGVFEYMFILSKGMPKAFNLIRDHKNKWAGYKVHGTDRQVNGETTRKKCWGALTPEYGVRFNVWHINAEKKNRTICPAPFPEQLAEDHILSWSNPGDTVLDPFLGSGTTGKMAVKNGRNFIGIEISEEYLQIAHERISSITNDTTTDTTNETV